ncbi:Hypothetical_protein [Hexamita inflata]|uniref:Hypothetical_protein n=1 Tax=Hexamita inflata TaxID=28002 RepID=A0AA86NE98_9EUKA|nr:Hypothetical protein HINF_LOCUS5812 [Hexamita inflata]
MRVCVEPSNQFLFFVFTTEWRSKLRGRQVVVLMVECQHSFDPFVFYLSLKPPKEVDRVDKVCMIRLVNDIFSVLSTHSGQLDCESSNSMQLIFIRAQQIGQMSIVCQRNSCQKQVITENLNSTSKTLIIFMSITLYQEELHIQIGQAGL